MLHAYVYENGIDKDTYASEKERLEVLLADKQQELPQMIPRQKPPKALLDFGARLLTAAAKQWAAFPAALKVKFQRLIFREGVNFRDGKFETPKCAH